MSDDAVKNQGPRSAGAFPENDPNADGVVGWELMGTRERLECCLAAVLARWPLDPATFRHDPQRDLVYVVRSNALDPKKADVAVRAVGSLHLSVEKLRAAIGASSLDVVRACGLRAERAARVLGSVR